MSNLLPQQKKGVPEGPSLYTLSQKFFVAFLLETIFFVIVKFFPERMVRSDLYLMGSPKIRK